MKMMPPDVISHENQLQYLYEPSIFMLDVFRTAEHAGQIFIPHRVTQSVLSLPRKNYVPPLEFGGVLNPSFSGCFGGLAPPSPYVVPPLQSYLFLWRCR